MPKPLLWIAAALLLLLGSLFYFHTPARPAPAYADTASCRPCHAAIAASYQSSGMARSFYRPTPANVPLAAPARFTHAPSGFAYETAWRDGKLIQRRRPENPDDEFEMEVHWVIGSGNHARTFLHQSPNGELTELPLSWYAETGSWAMSPGFDKPRHPDFSRRVDHGCLFCHNAYPPASAHDGARFGRPALFPPGLPQGIDCQRCHGPGSAHIASPAKSNIVNPARLDPARRMDVCLQCHLETTSAPLPSSTRRLGRGAYSFRPGEPLTDFMVYFDRPPASGRDGNFEIVSAAYRLRQSPCFLQSSGRLTCVTCHDPHKILRGAPAIAAQRQSCRQCHTASHHPDGDCASCHMPKRRAADAVHVVMTDHRIQRRPPPTPLAPLAETGQSYRGPIELYYPASLPAAESELYLGIAHSAHAADPARGIAQLTASTVSGPKVWSLLADAHMANNALPAALHAYEEALRLDPGLETARFNFAQALERSGDLASARRHLEQLNLPEARASLGNLLSRSGDAPGAIAAFRQAIAARPQEAAAHMGLAVLLLARGESTAALESASVACRIEPNNVEYQLNRARILYQLGQHAAATKSFERIVRRHPNSAEAHLSLGIAYGEAGRLAAAAAEFRHVLRLAPGHPEALKNLAIATAK